ncbi:MAG: hypothetical protein K0R47_1609, partial [Brevibacillus sp.]|nr:hypothetical protein [Brevibacillus sp.]
YESFLSKIADLIEQALKQSYDSQ